MSWHGVLSGGVIGGHDRMAAKVLRALPAVLVGGAARPVSAKDQLVRHSVGVRTSQLALRTADDAARAKR